MSRFLPGWLVLFFLTFGALAASAQTQDFEVANKLYYEGKFADAAAAYQKLLATAPRSPVLYFNLGNAFFKSGQIGRAVLAYRQAEKLSPRDPDVRANLQFAHNQVQGPTLKPDRYFGWLNHFTVNEWTVLASLSCWLLCIIRVLREFRPSFRQSLRNLAAAVSVIAAILCICLFVAWDEQRSTSLAVTTAPEAVLRAGPFDSAKNILTVHDGAELKVLDRKNDWLQVTPDNQRIGWLPRTAVVELAQ
jgi:tetratricopeptide (TPR) repeat protein